MMNQRPSSFADDKRPTFHAISPPAKKVPEEIEKEELIWLSTNWPTAE